MKQKTIRSSYIGMFIIMVSFLTVSLAEAQVDKRKNKKQRALQSSSQTKSIALSKEDFTKKVRKIKKKPRRKIAQTDTIEETQALSVEFRNIRNSFIGGEIIESDGTRREAKKPTTSQDVHNILMHLDKKYKNEEIKSQDARVLAAQLLIFKSFRGFIDRSRGLFVKKRRYFFGNDEARVAQTIAVTTLRMMASGLDTYLPSQEWKAFFNYTVEPFAIKKEDCNEENWQEACLMNTGDKLQIWSLKELLPRFLDLRKELLAIEDSGSHMYWDNKIIFSFGDFTHDRDRFFRLGRPEQLLLLSFVDLNISGILGFSAFHLTGFFEAMDDVAKVYGFKQAFSADLATSQDRWKAIKEQKNLFKYKNTKVAKENLLKSYYHLKSSLQNSYLAWEILDQGKSHKDNLIDSRLVQPFNRIFNTGFQNTFNILGVRLNDNFDEVSQGEVQSAVAQGEKVTVKLKEFFENPPNSLQDFMPIGFESGKNMLQKTVTSSEGEKETYEYRNYYKGNPNQWKYNVYKKYFPEVSGPEDVRRVSRVMAQSWGGFVLGLPLAMVMF